MRTYRTMLQNHPDFFIHSGDHIYADCPVPSELKLPNGETWRNIVTEEKSVVAHSLDEFRGNYKYNLLDESFRAFGLQFFGRVDIDGQTGVMTVTLKDVGNADLWSVDIEPQPDARPGQLIAQHI